MRLYFLRHAHAEDTANSDHSRQLTQEGIDAANQMAILLAELKVKPQKIYSSPRVHAHQTAEIVAPAMGSPVEIREEVNFGFSVLGVNHLIAGLRDADSVMFVGHEPTLSGIIGEITGGRVVMKKCGLARVDTLSLSPLKGELVWLMTPRIVDAIF